MASRPPLLAIESTHSAERLPCWSQPARVGPTFLLSPVRSALAALRRPIVRPYVIVLGAVSIEVCEVTEGRPGRCIAVIYFRGATMPQLGTVRQ